MDHATYDPTDGLNTNVTELVRCYVRCSRSLASSPMVTLYSSRRLLAAQLYALNGYILDDSPANFNHYQSCIAQAVQQLPGLLHEICFKKYVVYHVVKRRLTERLGEAMFCILKPAVQKELMRLFQKREAETRRPRDSVGVDKVFRFLNTYFQTDILPPDWGYQEAAASPQRSGSGGGGGVGGGNDRPMPLLQIGSPPPRSRSRSPALTPRHKRLAVLSNYHAVKRQIIGRFGEDVFNAHKSSVSDYLRHMSQFALPQSHSKGVALVLHAKEGMRQLLELVAVRDVLALSTTCTVVRNLLASEKAWETLCVRNFPAQSNATQLLQLCFHMTWREKFVMFNSHVVRRRVAAVVAPPPPPRQLRQWRAIMPLLAAEEAARAAQQAVDAELAAGAPAFPNGPGTGGSEPFDLCLGLLGHPKAGVSSLLHCFSLDRDVESVEAVPRYKSVLVTIVLRLGDHGDGHCSSGGGLAEGSEGGDGAAAPAGDSAGAERGGAFAAKVPAGGRSEEAQRTLRLLLLDLGALVALPKRIWFWRHANFTHIEHAAAQEEHNAGAERAFHNVAAMRGIVFCYDLADASSFDAVHKFWSRMRSGMQQQQQQQHRTLEAGQAWQPGQVGEPGQQEQQVGKSGQQEQQAGQQGQTDLPTRLRHCMFLGCKGDKFREAPGKEKLTALLLGQQQQLAASAQSATATAAGGGVEAGGGRGGAAEATTTTVVEGATGGAATADTIGSPMICDTSARWNIGVQWAMRRFAHAVATAHGIIGSSHDVGATAAAAVAAATATTAAAAATATSGGSGGGVGGCGRSGGGGGGGGGSGSSGSRGGGGGHCGGDGVAASDPDAVAVEQLASWTS